MTKSETDSPRPAYGCADYREEMRLMGLMRRMEQEGLTETEKELLSAEIKALEEKMGIG